MNITMVCGGNEGGIELNPSAVAHNTISSGQSKTETVDTSKHYILAVSANYTNSGFFMDTFYVDVANSEVTSLYDSGVNVTATVSGTTLTITYPSGSPVYSYTLIQLD